MLTLIILKKKIKKSDFFTILQNIYVSYLFWPADKIAQPSSRYGIAWLFRAAVGQTDFCQEVFLNLQPPLNALLNSRPV